MSTAATAQVDGAKVRVAIVGVGYWGPNLARNLYELPEVEFVGVADLDDARLSHAKQRYPQAHITNDYRDFLALDVDAVVIATPPFTHHEIAKEFLEHGVHCLVEKPLATNVPEAEELIRIAGDRQLTLMTGHTFEYNPAVREIKRLIDSGELGDIFYIDAVRTNLGIFQLNTDAMWDLAPHDISIANYLFGDKPLRITARGGSFVMRDVGVNDLVYLHLEYPGGRLANIRVSWLDPNKTRRTTVVGSKRMLVYDDVDTLEKLRVYDKGVGSMPFIDNYGEFQCSYRYGNVTIPHLSWEEPLRIECRHFIESILTKTTPQSDGHSGLRVIEALAAADRSLELGRMVGLDELRMPSPKANAAPSEIASGR